MTIIAACTSLVHYLPLATTVVATVFLADLVRRYCTKGKGIHLLWWAGGVATYGLGTALESVITLTGNTVLLNKSWYVMGALLGAYPLAPGRPGSSAVLTLLSGRLTIPRPGPGSTCG